MTDEFYMRRALQLAELGRGQVSPNPMVGSVVVHNDKIIGEGYHRQYGGPHAEVYAIEAVKNRALLTESTVYVTLEPCSHFGKTPPCADLLIRERVKRVVVATEDVNPKVHGEGIRTLKRANIDVSVGILRNEAAELNKRFITYHTSGRPYIILKWAQTADGFIARKNYDSKWISNAQSRQLVHKWRAEEDAVLVGKNTALYDNPSLTVRNWKGKNPQRIVIDRQLSLPNTLTLFTDGQSTWIYNLKKDEKKGHQTRIKLDKKDFELNLLMDLRVRRIQSLIIEGGAFLLHSFIEKGLWDEARVFESETSYCNGIVAPKLPMDPVNETFLFGDCLRIYGNK